MYIINMSACNPADMNMYNKKCNEKMNKKYREFQYQPRV